MKEIQSTHVENVVSCILTAQRLYHEYAATNKTFHFTKFTRML